MRPPAGAFYLLLLSILFSGKSHALFLPPTNVPIARLIKKLEAQCDKSPNDAGGHYAVARVHYLAFVANVTEIGVYEIDGKTELGGPEVVVRDRDGKLQWHGKEADRPLPARLYHAECAVKSFKDAIERAPENALYWLGYASVLEEIWSLVMQNKDDLFSPEFRNIRVPSLREAYGKAFALGKKLEGELTMRIEDSEDGLISYEAARALVRLSKASNDWRFALSFGRLCVAF